MSESQPPTGPGGAGQGRQPTEEEVRAYLAQLRQTDPAEVVAQAFSVLASAAEVKLGRRDARLLIDAAAAVAESVGERLDGSIRGQMDQAVGQLRMAQVDAEKQLAQMRAEGRLPADEAGDLSSEPGERPAAETPSAGETEEQGSPAADRLWIPGR
ncbi:MAG: hypothetical protein ACRDUY_05720 [Nitriliruptorales bacterium]